MNKDFFANQSHVVLIFILLVISYFVLMFGNGIISLTHPDEVFYIQSAKEMVKHNSWLTPMIFDHVQFEKPFISFALFAVAIKWFGLTPFVARFWPAFFGILGVVVVYWISFMLFGKKKLSFLAGIILCSSFIYVALSRAVLTDMIFTTWISISIGFFYFAYKTKENKTKGLIFCAIFTAIAVLTKGLLAITFVGGTILMFLAYKKDLRFLNCPAAFWSLVLFFLLALPWHVLMYVNNGKWFLDEYFGNVHFRRLFDSEHPKINKWFFYPGLLFAGILPWSLFWFPSISQITNELKKRTDKSDKILFLIVWIFCVFIFVQVAACKLASYVFPAFPAIAIIIAQFLDSVLEKTQTGEKNVSLSVLVHVMSFLLFCVSILAIFFGRKYIDILVSMAPIYVLSAFAFISAFVMLILNLRRNYLQLVFSYLCITATLLASLFFVDPYIEPWVSCKQISEVFKAMKDESNTVVLSSKFYVRGVRFYTDREMAVIDINGEGFYSPHPIPFLNTDRKVVDFLDSQALTYAIVKEGNVADLKRIASKANYDIEDFGGFGGKYILKLTKQ